MFACKVNQFLGSNESPAEADKHGKLPVILVGFAGAQPSKRVLSGTVAERNGLIVGKSYIVEATRGEDDPEYGEQWNYLAISEVSGVKAIIEARELGSASILESTKTPVPETTV